MTRSRLLFVAVLASAVLSLVVPIWAPAAWITTVIGFAALDGRQRLVATLLGGAITMVGFTRFLITVAAPNLLSSGTKFTEETAVSRLREIWFAEGLARQAKLVDTDGDGRGEYVRLERIVEKSGAFLKPEGYAPIGGGIYRMDGYDVAVYLPSQGMPTLAGDVDHEAAETKWIAYAWPNTKRELVRQRVFFIDQDERICEADNAQGYVGPEKVPPPFAAFTQPSLEGAVCMQGTDGVTWRPWKHKKVFGPKGTP